MDSLADELLGMILEDLRGHDLFHLLMVGNRNLTRVARAALYTHCDLITDSGGHDFRRTSLMLRSLIETPDLGMLVRTLRVQGSWYTSPPERYFKFTNINRCMTALSKCPYEFWLALSSALQTNNPDAMIVAVLIMSSNLKSLTFGRSVEEMGSHNHKSRDEFSDSDYPLTMRLIELSTTPELANDTLLKNLHSVTLQGCRNFIERWEGWSFGLFSTLLKLPSLKRLSASGFRDLSDGDVWDCQEGASNITDLSLFNNRISPESIRKLLRSCKALENFRCERLCLCCGTGEMPNVADYIYDSSYTNVHLDLFRHRKSLRSLCLSTSACGHHGSENHEPVHPLGILEHLEYLELDEEALWGARFFKDDSLDHDSLMADHFFQDSSLSELLPANLQRLIILGNAMGMCRAFWKGYGAILLSNHHSKLPIIEVRHTDMQFLHNVENVPGVSWKVIPDREGQYHHQSNDGSLVGTVLLHRSQQSKGSERPKESAHSEQGEQEDIAGNQRTTIQQHTTKLRIVVPE